MSKQKKVAQNFVVPLTDIKEVSHKGQRSPYPKLSEMYSWGGDIKSASDKSTTSVRALLAPLASLGDVAAFVANFIAVESDETDSILNLASLIAEVGQVQPIVVKPHKGGGWVNLAGERRMTACALGYCISKVPQAVLSDAFKTGSISTDNIDAGAGAKPKTGSDDRPRVYDGDSDAVAVEKAKSLKAKFADFPATVIASETDGDSGVDAGLFRWASDIGSKAGAHLDSGFFLMGLESAVKSMKVTSDGVKLPNFSAVTRELCEMLPNAKPGPLMQRVRAEITVAVRATPDERAKHRMGDDGHSWAKLCSKYGVGNKAVEHKPSEFYYRVSATDIGKILAETDDAKLLAFLSEEVAGKVKPSVAREFLSSLVESLEERERRTAAERQDKIDAKAEREEKQRRKASGAPKATKSLRV